VSAEGDLETEHLTRLYAALLAIGEQVEAVERRKRFVRGQVTVTFVTGHKCLFFCALTLTRTLTISRSFRIPSIDKDNLWI
jgi:hypothetical protein